jgi:6-phosphogluconolactonase (cycloisomerase 2 family)
MCACGSVAKTHPDANEKPDVSPVVTSLTPSSGIVTTRVTIAGTGFGVTQGTVTVGGVAATISSWSDTSIAIAIPDVMPGDADVVVTANVAAAPMTFHVILPPAIYLENDSVGSDGFDSVSALAFDPARGVAQIGEPISMGVANSGYGGCSTSIWVHAATRHLFAAGNGKVAVFDIDPITGALTAVSGSPFATGGGLSFGVLTNAEGTRLFVANYGGTNVGVLDIASDGTLTPITGSPFTTPFSTDTLALSKDETFLYVNSYGASYAGFSIDASGALTPLTGSQTGGTGIMRRPGTDELFIPNESNTVGVWNIGGNGSVTQLIGSPFSDGSTGVTQTGAFTPNGNRIYFGPFSSGNIVAMNVASDGTLTAVAGSPWNFSSSVNSVSCVAVSKDSAFLVAVGEGEEKVGVFSLDATGAPTPVTGSPFTYLPSSSSSSGLAITF